MSVPLLLLLAGTSEAGKSTAGEHLAAHGGHRVKIRTILTALTSGQPAVHEGVPVREGFDPAEFVEHVRRLSIPAGQRAVVIESFIDADLAAATRAAWPDVCRIVFITATRDIRLQRLAAARQLPASVAAAILDGKDARKRVAEQLDRWRALADDWIDNDGTHAAYLTRLDRVLADATRPNPPEEPR